MLSDPEALADSRRYRNRLLRELAKTHSRDRRRILVRRLLGSRRVHLWYAHLGIRRARVEGAVPAGPWANNLDLYLPSGEPATVIQRVKNDKVRLLLNFGPKARARQLLVRDILLSLHPSRPDQFFHRGGTKAALRAVNTAIGKGFRFGTELDVRDFYPNLKLDHLTVALRPLPRQVTEHVVWTDETDELIHPDGSIYTDADEPQNSKGPRGLAQGSAASSIAAELVLADVFTGLPHSSVIVNYADNVFVLGETEDAVAAASDYLATKLARLPSGPLEFKAIGDIADLLREGANFLGCYGEADGANSRLIWTPGERARTAIEAECEAEKSTLKSISTALARVRYWYWACDNWPSRRSWASTHQTELLAKLMYVAPEYATWEVQIAVYRAWKQSGGPYPISYFLQEMSEEELKSFVEQAEAR